MASGRLRIGYPVGSLILQADAGSYSLTGQAVSLSWSGGAPTVSHGSVLTINGSGFGSAPNFGFAGGYQGPIESTTIGQVPSNTAGGVNPGAPVSNPTDAAATVNDSWSWRRFSQNFIAATDATRRTVVGGAYSGFGTNPDVAMEYRFAGLIPNGAKIMASFWTRVSYAPGSSGQHKILRLCGGTSSNISDVSTDAVYTYQAFNGSVMMVTNNANASNSNKQTWYSTTNSSWNSGGSVWQKTEIYYQMASAAGVFDGQIFIRNFTGGSVPTPNNPTAYDGDGDPTGAALNSQWLSRPSNANQQMCAFLWENYVGNSWTSANLFQDDFFANTSNWRKIELWSAASAASATVRETQGWDSWSDTSIDVRINEGGLSPGTYWLTVSEFNGTGDTILFQQQVVLT